ncbi:asparaginase [Mesonia aquimarina]|uniref:asparaginase n=1 Tax=Mesonia aquimarina TaxID=1504967 RepID=UPI000EF574AE|nr:asparaginase [Mesonia aquimarina]
MINNSKILLVYTGGTIGMIKDFETGALRPFNFDELLQSIPELKLLDHEIETVSFENPIDSSNMNPEYYLKIAEIIEESYETYDGFVILHGSDTMSYSSSALSFMFENLNKPIIFTGSQLPIGDLRTDAKENLITSIQLAGLKKNGKNVLSEVGLYFEYKLYRANRTTKINAEHFQAFSSLNYPALAESGVHLDINEAMIKKANRRKKLIVHKELDNNIMVLKLFPGINENIINQLISAKGLKGIVLETYGSGNACNEDWFINLLDKAIKNGILIVNVTQCIGGSVVMGHYATSTRLEEIGVISGKDITTESAVAKMMYLLPKELSSKVFKTIFETSLRGEML